MSKHALRKAIRDRFPAESIDTVLSILRRYTDPSSPTRSFVAHMTMLQMSLGSKTLLEGIVTHICADSSLLPAYQHWLTTEEEYRTGPPYLRYFSKSVVPIALEAVPLRVSCRTHRLTLELFKPFESPSTPIYVVPLIEEGAFVTDARDCILSGKHIENLSQFSGKYVQCEEISKVVRCWAAGNSDLEIRM